MRNPILTVASASAALRRRRGPSGGGPPGGGGGGPSLIADIRWNSGTGSSFDAVRDSTNPNPFNFQYCSGTFADVLAVVPGAGFGWTLTPNVLQITARGSAFCGDVEWNTDSPIPVSTSHYGRFYFRAEEGFQTFHGISKYNTAGVIEQVPMDLQSTDGTALVGGRTTSNQVYIGIGTGRRGDGTTNDYPYNRFCPGIEGGIGDQVLDCDVWYRYEWFMEYLTATTIRVYPRLYDLAGNLLYDVNTYYPQNAFNATESLQDWYDAGNTLGIVSPENARRYAVGYEGSFLATDTGARFHKAALAFSLTDWVGPL